MGNSQKVWYIAVVIIIAIAAGIVIYRNNTSPNLTDMKKTQADQSVTQQKKEEQKVPKPVVAYAFPGTLPAARIANKQVTIKTKKGDITFEMFEQEAPKTVSNFVYLAEQQYYDNLTFHRVVPNFVIQGGDPSGNGTGGPGYKFNDEKVVRNYDQGIVAMANSGPDTNGSQFFIMLDNVPLPKLYTIFGKVTSGMDVVKQIQIGDIMETVTVEKRK